MRFGLESKVKLGFAGVGIVGLGRDVGAGRVVVTAAHVVVGDRRRSGVVRVLDRDAIEAVAQDRQHAASRRCIDRQRTCTRGLDPLG